MQLGQIIGHLNKYTITKQIYDSVWLATTSHGRDVIVKSVDHFRLQNERDVLLRFQPRTPHIRPLIEEIEFKSGPPALVLKHLDDDCLAASNKKRFTRPEVNSVAKAVLEALHVLHEDGFVHTDIKPSNILVNYGHSEKRIAEVQLCDFGSTVSQDSKYAKNGDEMGTPIFRSPEAHLQIPWTTSTDIWSFGATIISLLYGHGFHIFKPDVPAGHDDYEFDILTKHHRCFGPFPQSYGEIADQKRINALNYIMDITPPESLKPFHLTTLREITLQDREFLGRIMNLDPRDRPTARSLLEDEWFAEKDVER